MAAVAAISISARLLCGQLVHVCMRKHALLLHSSHGAFRLLNIAASDIYVRILFFSFLGPDERDALRDQRDCAQKTSSAFPLLYTSSPPPTSGLTAAFGSDRLETPAQFNLDKVKARRLSEAESADSHAAAQ